MILVDAAIWPWRGDRWAHLVSDESYEELHAFAARLGIPRRAFQGDHYDIPSHLRDVAIELSAEAVDSRTLVRRLRAAGLRRRPKTTKAPRTVDDTSRDAFAESGNGQANHTTGLSE